jgi:Plasmid pRiA4b ORF-3-like protein
VTQGSGPARETATYQVRVDLRGTRPPLWRRLELSARLHLDEVHDVLQAAFGWTDSHLHRFSSSPADGRGEAQYYLCPFDVAEGAAGRPEEQVRLDEALPDVGGVLVYEYDFGDDWEHVIRLEAVLPGSGTERRAACTGGERPGPPEDCGGPGGYELVVAAASPDDPGHVAALAELRHRYGVRISAEDLGITPFDLAGINHVIAALGVRAEPFAGRLPEPLEELADQLRSPSARRRLRGLAGEALRERAAVDAATAARMVRPYVWLLDRVGADGIALTGAGYLPPAHVVAAMAELDFSVEWPFATSRESDTRPVLDLRASATRMGLLRKHRGRLLVTSRGRAMADDPVALWWHIAARLPIEPGDPVRRQAGLLLLVAAAARSDEELHETVAAFLADIGWASSDGEPLWGGQVARAAWDTEAVLRHLGGTSQGPTGAGPRRPTADAALLARAAVQTWPGAS